MCWSSITSNGLRRIDPPRRLHLTGATIRPHIVPVFSPGGTVRHSVAAIIALIACTRVLQAQTITPPTPQFTGPDESFEVASVRVNTSGLLVQSSQIGMGTVSLVNIRV